MAGGYDNEDVQAELEALRAEKAKKERTAMEQLRAELEADRLAKREAARRQLGGDDAVDAPPSG